MANKKISQLTSMGTVGIGSEDYFPTAENLGGGNYATVKSSALQVSEYVLNPVPATQISGENKSIYFDNNDNWVDASNQSVESYPFLQVRKSDGLLVTGSGIAFDTTAVPWNYKAAQDIQMQGQNITGAGNIGFGNNNSINGLDRSRIYNSDGNGTDLQLLGYQDLTLSGNRNILLKAQGIDASLTPFVGEVRITGGDLVVDPDNRLVVNEIVGIVGETAADEAAVSINGALRNVPTATAQLQEVNWPDSNVQYRSTSTAGAINVDFTEPADGQTLTMYWRNTNSNTAADVTFRWGVGTDNKVRFGADDGPGVNVAAPKVAAQKTNVFTFVRIGDRIFGSAITGYVY